MALHRHRSSLRAHFPPPQTPHSNSGAFVDYALALPTFPTQPTDWALSTLLQNLIDLGKRCFSVNRIFIPVLGAVNTLLESGGLDELEADPRGVEVQVFCLSC